MAQRLVPVATLAEGWMWSATTQARHSPEWGMCGPWQRPWRGGAMFGAHRGGRPGDRVGRHQHVLFTFTSACPSVHPASGRGVNTRRRASGSATSITTSRAGLSRTPR